jgi:hypothetical protein
MTMEMLPMYAIATVGGILGLLLYFAPTIVAIMRKDVPSRKPIFLVNLLLGWTFIIWVVCLVWAFASGSPTTQQIAAVAKTYSPRATDKVLTAVEEGLEELLPEKEKTEGESS